jgi:glutathione S-transferase
MTIILYELCGADESHVFSPHCWKTRLSLAHKGLEFRSVPTAFTKIPEIEGGVTKSVPLIRDGDSVVQESFEIAKYLDASYPDMPTLLGGKEGAALHKFIISWSQSQLHPLIGALAMKDIHDILDDVDQTYFRKSREAKLDTSLENLHEGREVKIDMLLKALLPLKLMLKGQKYIGGDTPLFADYVVFGALQWLRMTCSITVLPQQGEVADWFNRLLDMYGGMGRGAMASA